MYKQKLQHKPLQINIYKLQLAGRTVKQNTETKITQTINMNLLYS